MLEIKKAVRHSVPILTMISGVSGAGKTYSALLVAAGLAGDKGRVGFIDSENGRGSMYADSPGIIAALPNGYDVIEISPPFAPQTYIDAIDLFEKAGCTVCVIDSGSHEWEGEGGISSIAENNGGRWNKAKLAHRKFVNRLLWSKMHLVVCLRAREKVKIISKTQSGTGKEEIVSLGILPVCEKNLPYEFMLSLMIEEKTHLASPLKCPEAFEVLFNKPKMIGKADGDRIREWNDLGVSLDPYDRLRKRARATADEGMEAYKAFFSVLAPVDKKALESTHSDNKSAAERADQERKLAEEQTEQQATSYVTNLTEDIPTQHTATGNIGEAGTTVTEEIATQSVTTEVATAVEAKPALAPETPQAEGPPEYRRHLHMWRELLGWPILLEIFGAFGFDHSNSKLADIPENHYTQVKSALMDRAQDLGKPLPDFDKPQTSPLGTVVKPTFGEPVVKTRRR